MADILDKPGIDLLPGSIARDPDIKAMASALDKAFAKLQSAINYVRDSHEIININDDSLLALKAWEKHVDYYDANQPREHSQALIKNANLLHMHKGTRWSVERIFELLNMRGVIVEWWEQPDDPEFEPYTFDIDIESDRVLTDEFISDCIRMVNALKNVRSHLRQIKMIARILSGIPVIGITAMNTTETTITPRIVGEAVVDIGVYLGIGAYGTAHTAVYPLAI